MVAFKIVSPITTRLTGVMAGTAALRDNFYSLPTCDVLKNWLTSSSTVQALTGQAAFGNRDTSGMQQRQPQQMSPLGAGGGGGTGGGAGAISSSVAINQLLYGPRSGPGNPAASSAPSPVPRPAATFGLAAVGGPAPGFLSTGTPGASSSFSRPSFAHVQPPSPHPSASPMATSTPMHSAALSQWPPPTAPSARPPFTAQQPVQTPRAGGASPTPRPGPAAGLGREQEQQTVISGPPAAAPQTPSAGAGPGRSMERVTSAPSGQVGAAKPEAQVWLVGCMTARIFRLMVVLHEHIVPRMLVLRQYLEVFFPKCCKMR